MSARLLVLIAGFALLAACATNADDPTDDAADVELPIETGATVPPIEAPPPPAPSEAPSEPTFEVGDSFSADCSVAWPSAPVRSADFIQMTMSCSGIPSRFQFVQVGYPDPDLPITPSTGEIHVDGEVVDIAQSEFGFEILVVLADDVELQ